MSIIVPCEHCGRRLKAPDRLAGRQAKCRCGTLILVPRGEAASPESSPIPSQSDVAPPRKSGRGFSIFDLVPEGLRESLPGAVRTMLISVIITAPLLVGGLYLLQSAMQYLEGIAPGVGGNVFFSRLPMLLAGGFGALFGFSSSKKIAAAGGLVGWPAFVVGALGAILLVGIGSLTGGFLFSNDPSPLFSYCLFCVAFMSLLGICFNAFWAS
jgi:hypothetical protein